MNYLLDTCTLSELVRKHPEKKVVEWIRLANESSLMISVLTLGEIHKGVSRLEEGKKKKQLQRWVESDLVKRFQNRILEVDVQVASLWGELQASAEKKGLPLPVVDSLIAATALAHDLTLVTRNTPDMERTGARILDLWA